MGLFDLRTLRLAMVRSRPDRVRRERAEGGNSPHLVRARHPEAATNLEPAIRHRLGLMIKTIEQRVKRWRSRARAGSGHDPETLNQLDFTTSAAAESGWANTGQGV